MRVERQLKAYPSLHPFGVVHLGTGAAGHKGCNWGMKIDWWLLPRVAFAHTVSGIVWHMLQRWSQFNRMTLSWWPRHEIVYQLHRIGYGWYEKKNEKWAEDRTLRYARAYWGSRDQLSSQIPFLFKSVHRPLYQEQYVYWLQIHKVYNKILCNYHANKLVLNWSRNDPTGTVVLILRQWRHLVNDSKYILCALDSQWLTGKCHKITEFR